MLPQPLSAWRAASELSCGSIYSMLMSHQCGPEHEVQLVERARACAHCLAADIALLTHLFLDALTWTISAAKGGPLGNISTAFSIEDCHCLQPHAQGTAEF